jgi:prepilin-type processing-associated H-X9-DG protein
VAHQIRSAGSINQLFSDGHVEFGDYRVTDFHASVVTHNGFSIGPYSEETSKERFRFLITGASSPWKASGMRQADANVIRVFKVDGVSRKSSVRCELHSGEQTASAELLDQMACLYATVQVDVEDWPAGGIGPNAKKPGVSAGLLLNSLVGSASFELATPAV